MSDQQRRPDVPAVVGGFVSNRKAAVRLGFDVAEWDAPSRLFPVRWPTGYLDLAASEAGQPIRQMGLPDREELLDDPEAFADPVGERDRSPHPLIVRKHRDRAILLVTARCHFYCRFCFRRSFPDGDHAEPRKSDLDRAIDLLVADPDLTEVILSGGDPLTLDDARLAAIVARLGESGRLDAVRIHTRAPVHFPERVTPELIAALARGPSPWLVTHYNHAVELTEASLDAVRLLQRSAIPVLNQAVLLAGVNDTVESLVALCRGLYRAQVKPYYLHHPDRVPGTARFRLTIARGLELFESLRARVPGPALPAYVIDLPDGSGKVPVSSLVAIGEGRYRCPGGMIYEDVGG